MLSFLLALSVWFIHNLSLRYTETISIPILVKSNIEGYACLAERPVTINARCRTTGFNLLRLHYNKEIKEIFFDPSHIERAKDGSFYILSSVLPNYFKEIFGDDLTLETFLTNKLEPVFLKENHKKVPVQFVAVLSYKSQYMAKDKTKIKPDSIVIYGHPNDLDNIKMIKTKPVKHHNLSSDTHGFVDLQEIHNIRYSDTEVSYSIPVTRYVEIRQNSAKIYVKNKPKGLRLSIYPSKANIRYFCTFPLTADPSKQVKVYIDYKDFQKSINGGCVPILKNLPSSVISYEIEPQVFECVEN